MFARPLIRVENISPFNSSPMYKFPELDNSQDNPSLFSQSENDPCCPSDFPVYMGRPTTDNSELMIGGLFSSSCQNSTKFYCDIEKYKNAIKAKDLQTESNLSEIHFSLENFDQEAIDWLKTQNDGVSFYLLGIIYKEGYQVTKNLETAKEYFKQSEQLDFFPALSQLAEIDFYENNSIESEYFQKACRNGCSIALGLKVEYLIGQNKWDEAKEIVLNHPEKFEYFGKLHNPRNVFWCAYLNIYYGLNCPDEGETISEGKVKFPSQYFEEAYSLNKNISGSGRGGFFNLNYSKFVNYYSQGKALNAIIMPYYLKNAQHSEIISAQFDYILQSLEYGSYGINIISKLIDNIFKSYCPDSTKLSRFFDYLTKYHQENPERVSFDFIQKTFNSVGNKTTLDRTVLSRLSSLGIVNTDSQKLFYHPTCVICCHYPSCKGIKGCGHLSFCNECFEQITKCPFCRDVPKEPSFGMNYC